ncbi:cell division protein FtsQ/DivIB [Rhodobacter ferrooxidans]|uniref:Cell division protein FtsQ n=1 Tax=Rhodobacter ferrooxidans TaxID=371731 RepID=C8S481_9RHOB|nr:cell division protein FtsQ/DivIB [Rhodobacter sp. SW2]EEW24247.1 cell division protein FtsQ [Rhodobacter sp. SW2]
MQPLIAPPRLVATRAVASKAAPAPARAEAKAEAPRRDPAPSRAAYRWHRLWLTPLFRTLMRVGLPAFVIVMGLGLYLGNADRRAALTGHFTDLRAALEQRPEFMVSLMSIDGATPALADAIRKVAAVPLPKSSFDIDLLALRDRIATLDAVATADVRVKSGGVLQIRITERVPAVVLRKPDALELLDASGHRVALVLARADRPDLPLLAGDGAAKAVPEALQIIAAAGPLVPRLRGLVRMGDRRWDIVLDRDQRILLPATDPVKALERILALDKAENLLARDILTVDLRLQERPVLRLAPNALREMRRANGIETVESSL